MSFIAVLRRRNVFRVAVYYIVAAWLIIQVADILLDALAVPDWGMRLILVIALLGFPVVVTFSWIFELTPEGLKREKDIDRSTSVTPRALSIDPGLHFAQALQGAGQLTKGAYLREIQGFERVLIAEPTHAAAANALTYDLLLAGYFKEGTQ